MQTDTWWQLRAGRDMWASRSVLLTDVVRCTRRTARSGRITSGWPRSCSTRSTSAGGLPLLTLFAAGLILGGWTASWRLATGPVRERFLWVGIALIPSSLWWEPRPHAFSLLFIVATVFLIARRRVWWLPLVFVVWANVHGGVLLGFIPRRRPRCADVAGAEHVAAVGPRLCRVSARRDRDAAGLCVLVRDPEVARTHQPVSAGRMAQAAGDGHPRAAVLDHRRNLPVPVVRNRHRLRRLPPDEAAIYACALALLPMAVSAIRNVGPFVMIAAPALTSLVRLRREPDGAAQLERPPAQRRGDGYRRAIGRRHDRVGLREPDSRSQWVPVPPGVLAALPDCPDNL